MSDQNKDILKNLSRKYFGQLTELSRKDNAEALKLLQESGITFTTIDNKSELESFYEAGKKARRDLIGKLYDENILLKVEGMLEKFRSDKAK